MYLVYGKFSKENFFGKSLFSKQELITNFNLKNKKAFYLFFVVVVVFFILGPVFENIFSLWKTNLKALMHCTKMSNKIELMHKLLKNYIKN